MDCTSGYEESAPGGASRADGAEWDVAHGLPSQVKYIEFLLLYTDSDEFRFGGGAASYYASAVAQCGVGCSEHGSAIMSTRCAILVQTEADNGFPGYQATGFEVVDMDATNFRLKIHRPWVAGRECRLYWRAYAGTDGDAFVGAPRQGAATSGATLDLTDCPWDMTAATNPGLRLWMPSVEATSVGEGISANIGSYNRGFVDSTGAQGHAGVSAGWGFNTTPGLTTSIVNTTRAIGSNYDDAGNERCTWEWTSWLSTGARGTWREGPLLYRPYFFPVYTRGWDSRLMTATIGTTNGGTATLSHSGKIAKSLVAVSSLRATASQNWNNNAGASFSEGFATSSTSRGGAFTTDRDGINEAAGPQRDSEGYTDALLLGKSVGTPFTDRVIVDVDPFASGSTVLVSDLADGTAWLVLVLLDLATASGPTTYTQSLSAGFTPSAALTKRTSKALAAGLAPAAALARRTARALTAGLTPSAAVTGAKLALQSLTAGLAPSATLATFKSYARSLTAGITPSSALGKLVTRSLTAGLAPSRTLTKQTAKPLTADLTPSTSLTRRTARVLAAALTPTAATISAKVAQVALTATVGSSTALATLKGLAVLAGSRASRLRRRLWWRKL